MLPGSPWTLKVGQPAALMPRLVMFSTPISSTIYDLAPPSRATYTTSNSQVASVDANGAITATAAGTATLTVMYLGKSADVRVVVGTQDTDAFAISGTSVTGRLGIDARLSYGSTVSYWLVTAPSGVITHHIVDQNGRSLGTNPTAEATSGGPKAVSFNEDIVAPAGTTRICTSATIQLSTGTRLSASGFCDNAR